MTMFPSGPTKREGHKMPCGSQPGPKRGRLSMIICHMYYVPTYNKTTSPLSADKKTPLSLQTLEDYSATFVERSVLI